MVGRFLFFLSIGAVLGSFTGYGLSRIAPQYFEGTASVIPALSDAAGQGRAVAVLRSPDLLQQALTSLEGPRSSLRFGERSVVRQLPGNVVQVEVLGRTSARAANLANGLLGAYRSLRADTNSRLSQEQEARLKANVVSSQKAVENADQSLVAFESKTGIIGVDDKIKSLADYKASLQASLDSQTTQIAALEQTIQGQERTLHVLPAQIATSTTEATDPTVATLKAQLADLESQRVNLLGIYREKSQRIQEIDTKINATKAQIAHLNLPSLTVNEKKYGPNPVRDQVAQSLSQNQADLLGMQASIAEIHNVLNGLAAQSKNLPSLQAQEQAILRARDEAIVEAQAASGALNQFTTDGPQGALPELNVIMPATPEPRPVFPDPTLFSLCGLGLGVLVGGLAGLSGRRRQALAEVPQPSPLSGPAIDALPRTTAPPLPSSRKEGLAVLALPAASPAEAYRFMVFSLQTRRTLPLKMLFTPVSSDALGAEAAAQFAIAMAQTGVRTMLADANLRYRGLSKAFHFQAKSGISDMLSKTMLPVPGNDLLLRTEHDGLVFLAAGSEEGEGLSGVPNQQIAGMLADMDDKADVIVLSTPPCTVVSDSARLAPHVDEVYLIASKADELKGLVVKAGEIMRIAGAKRVEVVLIDSHESKTSFIG